MKRLRTLIVDDEELAREGIALLLRDDPEIEVVASAEDGVAALAAITAHRPDLVFLDVQMPEAGGLEVIEALAPELRPFVIFVTAHHQHAVQAFELSAIDYVLKPFRDDRFQAALSRAKEHIRQADLTSIRRQTTELLERLRRLEAGMGKEAPASSSRLALRVGNEHVFVEAREIGWVEAQGPCVRLCAGGRTLIVRESLQSIEQRLDPGIFVRIHRSFIVNRTAVGRITPARYGDHTVWTTDGAALRLSRSYRDRLKLLVNTGG